MDEALAAANMTVSDVDWLVPHQANIRIINTQKKMQLPTDRVVRTVDKHATTSAASIPLAPRLPLVTVESRMGRLLPSKPLVEVLSGVRRWSNTAAPE